MILLIFKCLKFKEPSYLFNSFSIYVPRRCLRSIAYFNLDLSLNKTSIGDKAFSYTAAKLFNNLPSAMKLCDSLDVFKKDLKFYLFNKAYNC